VTKVGLYKQTSVDVSPDKAVSVINIPNMGGLALWSEVGEGKTSRQYLVSLGSDLSATIAMVMFTSRYSLNRV
jgi:hypothetical protein